MNCGQVNAKFYRSPVGKRDEAVKLVDMNLDICKFFQKQKRGDVFARFFIDMVQKKGNVLTRCPYKAVSVVFKFSY